MLRICNSFGGGRGIVEWSDGSVGGGKAEPTGGGETVSAD